MKGIKHFISSSDLSRKIDVSTSCINLAVSQGRIKPDGILHVHRHLRNGAEGYQYLWLRDRKYKIERKKIGVKIVQPKLHVVFK